VLLGVISGGPRRGRRIHQLQQLLGDKLTDPDARLTMELALRVHLLLTPPTPA
jgi:DNA-binding PucR family transcriptional regulator